eukprot:gene4082-5058_t
MSTEAARIEHWRAAGLRAELQRLREAMASSQTLSKARCSEVKKAASDWVKQYQQDLQLLPQVVQEHTDRLVAAGLLERTATGGVGVLEWRLVAAELAEIGEDERLDGPVGELPLLGLDDGETADETLTVKVAERPVYIMDVEANCAGQPEGLGEALPARHLPTLAHIKNVRVEKKQKEAMVNRAGDGNASSSTPEEIETLLALDGQEQLPSALAAAGADLTESDDDLTGDEEGDDAPELSDGDDDDGDDVALEEMPPGQVEAGTMAANVYSQLKERMSRNTHIIADLEKESDEGIVWQVNVGERPLFEEGERTHCPDLSQEERARLVSAEDNPSHYDQPGPDMTLVSFQRCRQLRWIANKDLHWPDFTQLQNALVHVQKLPSGLMMGSLMWDTEMCTFAVLPNSTSNTMDIVIAALKRVGVDDDGIREALGDIQIPVYYEENSQYRYQCFKYLDAVDLITLRAELQLEWEAVRQGTRDAPALILVRPTTKRNGKCYPVTDGGGGPGVVYRDHRAAYEHLGLDVGSEMLGAQTNLSQAYQEPDVGYGGKASAVVSDEDFIRPHLARTLRNDAIYEGKRYHWLSMDEMRGLMYESLTTLFYIRFRRGTAVSTLADSQIRFYLANCNPTRSDALARVAQQKLRVRASIAHALSEKRVAIGGQTRTNAGVGSYLESTLRPFFDDFEYGETHLQRFVENYQSGVSARTVLVLSVKSGERGRSVHYIFDDQAYYDRVHREATLPGHIMIFKQAYLQDPGRKFDSLEWVPESSACSHTQSAISKLRLQLSLQLVNVGMPAKAVDTRLKLEADNKREVDNLSSCLEVSQAQEVEFNRRFAELEWSKRDAEAKALEAEAETRTVLNSKHAAMDTSRAEQVRLTTRAIAAEQALQLAQLQIQGNKLEVRVVENKLRRHRAILLASPDVDSLSGGPPTVANSPRVPCSPPSFPEFETDVRYDVFFAEAPPAPPGMGYEGTYRIAEAQPTFAPSDDAPLANSLRAVLAQPAETLDNETSPSEALDSWTQAVLAMSPNPSVNDDEQELVTGETITLLLSAIIVHAVPWLRPGTLVAVWAMLEACRWLAVLLFDYAVNIVYKGMIIANAGWWWEPYSCGLTIFFALAVTLAHVMNVAGHSWLSEYSTTST